MKLCPVTPRTPRLTAIGTGSKYTNMPRYRKVDNFIANLFGDSMETEHFVSTHNQSSTFRSNKYHLPHLWYQFNDRNELRQDNPEKASHQNLDFYRDLGPLQRKTTNFPEKEKRFYIGHSNTFNVMQEPLKGEELYMLSLSGLLPLNKVPVLHQRIKDIEDATTFDSTDSHHEINMGDVRRELCDLVDWEKMSDGNAFDESYGEESHYGSEVGSHLDDNEMLNFDGVDNEDSSD